MSAFALCVLLSGCDLNREMTTMAIGQQVDYINAPVTQQARLERVSDAVWTYNWYFDRTLIIDTAEGLVVVDPFSPELTANLRRELNAAGLAKPVHTIIYSHYHMDHTRGAASLSPQNVLCHARCAYWWGRFPPADIADVLAPTRTIEGDTTLAIGGVEIQLLHLGNAHTDTNYAVLIPEERVLYAADTLAIRSLLPVGGVSIFMPDYLAALDRLNALDFDTFVSSHFSWGTKSDFSEAVRMQHDSWTWITESFERTGGIRAGEVPLINDRERFEEAYRWYYARMKERYGNWHGFEAQIAPTFLSGFVAQQVGS